MSYFLFFTLFCNSSIRSHFQILVLTLCSWPPCANDPPLAAHPARAIAIAIAIAIVVFARLSLELFLNCSLP
jgi:hypothetical protein